MIEISLNVGQENCLHQSQGGFPCSDFGFRTMRLFPHGILGSTGAR